MDIVVAVIAILLTAVIGFAVHRASLCNVKAVAELLTSKRAHMLGSFFKTMLWVIAVTLTPGGNDALILHAIPGGSPHALPAYGALLVGTAVGLIVIRAIVGTAVKVECTGDICRTRPVPIKS